MRAYKFLLSRPDAGGRERLLGPFSGTVWPPPGAGSVADVSACRLADLPYWIADSLWVVELEGAITEGELKVTASSGRLVERVEGWAEAAMAEFSAACARRLRDRVAGLVRAAGFDGRAVDLEACDDLAELSTVAAACAEAIGDDRTHDLARLVLFAGDAGDAAAAGRTALAGYLAAHGAEFAAARVDPAFPDGVDAHLEERGLQSSWFADRLGLG